MKAYPLQWPMGYKRTELRKDSRFKTTLAQARDYVQLEVQRLKATGLIISTNLPVDADGELHAGLQSFKTKNPGVAIYFLKDTEQVTICCDHYNKVHDNLYAIGRTIEALRQIDRDGVSDFLKRAFTGFKALPEAAPEKSPWLALNLPTKPPTKADVETAYKKETKIRHPDVPGGSHEAFIELKKAYEKALTYF